MTDPAFIQKEQDEYNWLDWLPLFFIAASLLIAIWYYPSLPDKIPTHFNLKGEPDDWSSKNAVFMLPGIAVFMYGIMMVVIKGVPPRMWNLPVKVTPENAEVQYRLARNMMRALNAVITGFFCLMNYLIIQVALGKLSTLNNLFMFGLFGAIGLVFTVYIMRSIRYK